ncbi:hypothetical protein EB008_03440 [bacterium]|nr:hypothetical protein [Chlamydiota bacterium]NDD99334.1 hypothetical protein [bacterium]
MSGLKCLSVSTSTGWIGGRSKKWIPLFTLSKRTCECVCVSWNFWKKR